MDNFLLYLLKVSVAMIVFYLSYILFFGRDTFYRRNRFLLVGILLLSVIIPLPGFFNFSVADATSIRTNSVTSIILSGALIGETVTEKISSFDFFRILTLSYILISFLFLLRGFISVTHTLMIVRKGTIMNTDFPRIVVTELELPPFSFFPYVVIPKKMYESGDCSEILVHENAHITQGHTFDLLLSELLIAFLWFNPFIWLIKRAMVLNHEYLADNLSLKSSFSIKEYQYKLLSIPSGLMNVSLAHNFSNSIKNRIIMINKKPTRNYAALKSFIILPVVAILFVMFSFKPETNPQTNAIQQPLFSKTSESEILKFIARNTRYPQEAKTNHDTGSVFVVLKMGKGGKIIISNAITLESKITVPVLHEVVIVAYIPTVPGQDKTNVSKAPNAELPLLKAECIRVVNTLGSCEIPEWKDKDMEFAIAFKFTLK